MAEGLEIGTLSGRIEITDNSQATVDVLTQRITGLESKFDSLSGRVDSAAQHQSTFRANVHESGESVKLFDDQLSHLTERIVEAFAIREVFRFAGEILEEAHALEILSKQTGIGVEELQVLGAATKEYGIDADQMGRAIFQLSQRIAGGDQSTVTALHMMGLSIQDVKNLHGEELFLTVERALGTLQGTMKDSAAADLFGARMGKAMEAFSTDVDGAIDRAKEWNHIASEESVKATAELELAFKRLDSNIHSVATSLLGPLAEGANTLVESSHKIGFWNTLWRDSVDVLADTAGEMTGLDIHTHLLSDALDEQNKKQAESTKQTKAHAEAKKQLTAEQQAAVFMSKLEIDAAQKLEEWQIKDLNHLRDIGALNVKNAEAIGVNSSQFDLYKKNAEAAAEADKKFAKGWEDLNSLGATYQDTVKGIDASIADSVKYYASLGAKVQDLTDAFPQLTKAQAEAAVEAAKAAKEIQKANEAAALSSEKAWAEYASKLAALTGTDTQKAQAAADKDYQIHVAEAQAKGVTDVDYYNSLWALRNKDIELSDQQRLLSDSKSKESLLKKIADAQDYMNFMRAHYASYTDADRDAQQKVIDNLKTVRDHWGQVGNSIDADTEKVKTLSGEVLTLKQYEERQLTGGSQEVTSANFQDKLNSYQIITSAGPQGVQSTHPLIGMDESAERLARMGYSWEEIVDILVNHKKAGPPAGPRIPGFREGGIGDFGAGTLAMLHGREAIVPLDKGIGFGAPNITIHVNGTAQDVARKVADEISRTLKYSRQYGAA